MLLRSSEVRLLFIDLYQNSTQHSVVAVVPPTQPPPSKHPLMMNRFLASVPSPPSHELRPQLWLSHCISRIPEFNPLVRVLSSGQLTIKLPRARRGVGPTIHTLHPPSLTSLTRLSHHSFPLCSTDRSSRSNSLSLSSSLGCICFL